MNSIKKNVFYSSLYQIINIIVPLITTPYLARVLKAEGIGVYSYSFSVAQLFVIFILLGLNNYGNREISSVRDSKERLHKTFWSIYVMQLILGCFVNVFYLLFCLLFSSNFKASIILGLYVLSACFDINWFYFGIERFKFISIRNISIKILSTLCIFLFIKDNKDCLLYCIIMGISFMATQLTLWPYILKNIKPTKISRIDVLRHIRPNLFLFITVIAVNIYKYMDKVMLGGIDNNAQVGFFEVSEKIINIPTSIINALGSVMLPRVTYMIANGINGYKNLLNKSIEFTMFFVTTICFGIMGISRELIPIFLGAGYEECINIVLILLPSCLFLSIANIVRTQYLLPHGMDNCYVTSAIIGALINLIINLKLIPQYGAIGAAIGTIAAEFSVCAYQLFCVRKDIDINKLIMSALRYIISGLVMFCIIYNIESQNLVLSMINKIILGAIIYLFILIVLFRMSNKKLSDIYSLFSSK